jgi:hypothetical protein
MKPQYLFYGILAGLAPLIIGMMAAMVDPHGDAAQLPWFAMVTAPAGLLVGLILMFLL